MLEQYAWYNTDYLSGVMSLRKPQSDSLKILEDLFLAVNPQKISTFPKRSKPFTKNIPSVRILNGILFP